MKNTERVEILTDFNHLGHPISFSLKVETEEDGDNLLCR